MSSGAKQALYLVLAVAGAVGTWYFNLQMDDLGSFFSAMWDTPLTSSLSADLTVACLTFFAFMLLEAKKQGIRPLLVGICFVLTFAIAFAFAFPLFMFFRERAMAKAEPA